MIADRVCNSPLFVSRVRFNGCTHRRYRTVRLNGPSKHSQHNMYIAHQCRGGGTKWSMEIVAVDASRIFSYPAKPISPRAQRATKKFSIETQISCYRASESRNHHSESSFSRCCWHWSSACDKFKVYTVGFRGEIDVPVQIEYKPGKAREKSKEKLKSLSLSLWHKNRGNEALNVVASTVFQN